MSIPGDTSDDNAVIYWGEILVITGLAASMAVNTLMTGMILFRILKVTRAIPITSIERTLGSTGGDNFRHVMFIIIESGMALFAVQLVRVLLVFIPVRVKQQELFLIAGNNIAITFNQMLNVIIIRSIHFYFFCFSDNIYLARASHQL